jgi:hypothetical protein
VGEIQGINIHAMGVRGTLDNRELNGGKNKCA